jgi:hypothetical protein
MSFNTTINTLTGNNSFYDWFIKENNEVISKLNQCTVSGVTNGDGVLVSLNATSGLATLSLGATSGTIQTGLTFGGTINFTGQVNIPNISYNITGITVGTPGYTFGSVVRITSSGYTAAKANDPDSAEIVGVLSALTSSSSTVTLAGRINGNFQTVAGGTLSPGCVYFLDPTTAGYVTTTEPTTIGQVSKPVLLGLGETAGVVLQYRGNYLNASGSAGGSGSNRFFITLPTTPTDPRLYGFSAGNFISYHPDAVSGNPDFNAYLVETGRTAINGYFLSGSYLYGFSTSQAYDIPSEDDCIIGMIENITTSGSDLIYQLISEGETNIIPNAISTYASDEKGIWGITGGAYLVSASGVNQISKLPATASANAYRSSFLVGVVTSSSPTSWYVNLKPSGYYGDAPSGSASVNNTQNHTFNGDFSIWQRSTGRDAQYTTLGNIYFADNWIRRQEGVTNGVQYIERKTFPVTSTSVEGNPEYYVDLKCISDPAYPAPASTMVYSAGHVIDNIESFNGSKITISFYAKCTQPNYTANVYFARYANNALVSKNTVSTINLSTSWTKHTLTYTVPSLGAGTYDDDYIEVGIDLKPLVVAARTASVATGTNLVTSIASMCVYQGQISSPTHYFNSIDEKMKKAQKYYFTTYNSSQTAGSKTMNTFIDPVLNVHTFQYLPASPFNMYKLPVKMRESPNVSIYSPSGTISQPEIYNYTATRDLKNTSGTKGYNNETRMFASLSGTPTVSTSQDDTTIRININGGAVPYDVLTCHIIADASYPI